MKARSVKVRVVVSSRVVVRVSENEDGKPRAPPISGEEKGQFVFLFELRSFLPLGRAGRWKGSKIAEEGNEVAWLSRA